MATTSVEEEESSSKSLKCQTWVLKVSIHCQGCKRKVKKVLLGIDGVYSATVDSQQQRVTVTGNIEVETLIKRLIKRGKHAEIWPETSPSNPKQSCKPNNTRKQNNNSNNEKQETVKFREETKDIGKPAVNPTVSEELPEVNNNVGENEGVKNTSNRKKKKGVKKENNNNNNKNERNSTTASASSNKAADTTFQAYGMGTNQAMGSSNLSPTRNQSVPYPQGYYNIPPPCASTHRMTYPREYYPGPGPFFNVPSVSPYPKVTPPDSFFYFSDENVHGCSIM